MRKLRNLDAPMLYNGKSLGVLVLVAIQLLIGLIHIFFGLWFLSTPRISTFTLGVSASDIYSTYTIIFGFLTLIFAAGLWLNKLWGWIGTVTVSVFVILADTLTLLDLPSIPGIPKIAGFFEISYSLLVLVYLLQPHILTSFKIRTS